MGINWESKTRSDLETLVERYRAQGLESHEVCQEALRRLGQRLESRLDVARSVDIIRRLGAQKRFVSYADIGSASGADWSRVHWQVNRHLDDVCRFAHEQGWPLITAIVVNAANVADGRLNPESLEGFLKIAHTLGRYAGTTESDADAFLRSEQRMVFAWSVNGATI
jgi:hypothetical protein